MIYYTSSTGTIIGGTAGSSQNDLKNITHLPSGANYAVYIDDTTVQSLNPSNLPGTYSLNNVTSDKTYTVPTAAGALIFTELPLAQQLSNAQTAQITLIQTSLASTLADGFRAKTLVAGATLPHTYPSDSDAQSNFSGAISAFTANPSKTNVTIETLDAGWINHTKAEFFGVFSDGDSWKEAQYAQYNNLLSQISAATTVSAVQNIIWTPATY